MNTKYETAFHRNAKRNYPKVGDEINGGFQAWTLKWRAAAGTDAIVAGISRYESMDLVPASNTCGENVAGEKNINHAVPTSSNRRESPGSSATDLQCVEKQRFWMTRGTRDLSCGTRREARLR